MNDWVSAAALPTAPIVPIATITAEKILLMLSSPNRMTFYRLELSHLTGIRRARDSTSINTMNFPRVSFSIALPIDAPYDRANLFAPAFARLGMAL
jgi:hypothetical protein